MKNSVPETIPYMVSELLFHIGDMIEPSGVRIQDQDPLRHARSRNKPDDGSEKPQAASFLGVAALCSLVNHSGGYHASVRKKTLQTS